MWDSFFEWVRAHELGGSSFVEFVTALNIATASWDHFQKKLQTLQMKCQAVLSDGILESIDQKQLPEIRQWVPHNLRENSLRAYTVDDKLAMDNLSSFINHGRFRRCYNAVFQCIL